MLKTGLKSRISLSPSLSLPHGDATSRDISHRINRCEMIGASIIMNAKINKKKEEKKRNARRGESIAVETGRGSVSEKPEDSTPNFSRSACDTFSLRHAEEPVGSDNNNRARSVVPSEAALPPHFFPFLRSPPRVTVFSRRRPGSGFRR